MATTDTSAPYTGTATAVSFRAWAQAISDGLTACGFAKTADTGQFDIASGALNAAANTISGYEVRAFSGADQADAPLFVKISYGNTGTTVPAVWLQFGTATDGVGGLTGMAAQHMRLTYSATSATPARLLMSGDGSRFALVHRVDAAVAALAVLSFERLPGGLVGTWATIAQVGYGHVLPRSGADLTAGVDALPGPVLYNGTGLAGADLRLLSTGYFTPAYAHSGCWLGYHVTDLTDLAVVTVTVNGEARNYKAISTTQPTANGGPVKVNPAVAPVTLTSAHPVIYQCFLIRWE